MRLIEEIRGNYRKYLLMLIDASFFCIISYLVYALSAVGEAPSFVLNSGILLVAMFIARIVLGVYRTVWRYTSTRSYFNLMLADLLGTAAAQLVTLAAGTYVGLLHYVVVAALTAQASLMSRLCYRLWYKKRNDQSCSRARKVLCQ